ncbi:hypothetical protein SNL152K_6760 [Streptomyces sp. NL15-2K]|nr:hypothetical protein SNL152K_6760 [Streptomyces sp. NL15-2K]
MWLTSWVLPEPEWSGGFAARRLHTRDTRACSLHSNGSGDTPQRRSRDAITRGDREGGR